MEGCRLRVEKPFFRPLLLAIATNQINGLPPCEHRQHRHHEVENRPHQKRTTQHSDSVLVDLGIATRRGLELCYRVHHTSRV